MNWNECGSEWEALAGEEGGRGRCESNSVLVDDGDAD